MKSISFVFHGENKVDMFDTAREAADFSHEVVGGFRLVNSEEVSDHTAAAEEVEWENYNARSKALELALRTGVHGAALIQSAEQIREYLESGTVAGKKSGTTPIPL